MEIPLVSVTARICDQQGRPVHRAQITMRLTTVERYCGLVVPREARAETDPQGNAVLRVWPNELGTEGSEYMVTISFPEACHAGYGKHPSHLPPLHSLRYRCTVPNADCNLQDIAELPPYEQRGSGQVITAEVAAFASQAAGAADRAQHVVETIGSIRTGLEGLADEAASAKVAAQEAARQAQGHERRAQELLDGADDKICHFENSVTARTERAAQQLVKDATICLTQAKTDALDAIEQRSGDVLHEIGKASSDAQGTAANVIAAVRENAIQDIATAKTDALRELHEDARLFGEDFENLTERALSAAKRAGCSAASAQNSAVKACECATRAERAAQGMERYRDDALDAARRAENAESCAGADAQRAEAAANSARKSADHAAGSALAAQKAAQAADAGAKDANLAATQSIAAQQATARDREYLDGIVDDARRAVHEVAVDALTPEVVTDAVQRATQTARDAANAAGEKSAEAGASAATASERARLAGENADRAEAARGETEDAAERAEHAAATAEASAARLETGLAEQRRIAEMATQITRLADRVTKVELDHARGVEGGSAATENAMPAEGVELSPGVRLSAITIAESGHEAPEGAAVTAFVSDFADA